MLLAIDIGNSNISVGLFDREKTLKFLASIDTDSRKTADQISIDLMNLFTLYGCDIHDVSGAILSSVVPPMNFMMEKALTRLLGKPPMVVGAGIKTGLNIRMEFNSQQLGADIVANAVSALEKYPVPIIMIDMGTVYGTAAMLDGVIDRIRETLGGAEPSIVATGPNAPVIARYCRNHVVYDKYLLMEGLYAIYQKNAK